MQLLPCPRRRPTVLLAMSLLLSVSACGVGDDTTADGPRASTTTRTPATNPAGDVKKFCAAEAALDKSFDDKTVQDGRRYAAEVKRVEPLLRQYEESAPKNLRNDAHALVEAVRRIGEKSVDLDPNDPESGDKLDELFSELDKTVGPASKRLDAYKDAHCPKR